MASMGKNVVWTVLVYVLLITLGLAVLGLGIVEMNQGQGMLLLGIGALIVVVPSALYPLAAAIQVVNRNTADHLRQVDITLELLRSIKDRLLLSEASKRIAYREQDRDTLRRAVREDIDKGEFDAALILSTQMSQVYGAHEESEGYREEIILARTATLDKKISDSIASLDGLLKERNWDQAAQEAAKIQRLYPGSDRVVGLEQQVAQLRDQHKRELEQQFLQAAERDDVDMALKLLMEMDKYLTEAEAEPFRETARGVIGKKRDNLGVQFKLAVHDKDWSQAVRVGEQIIRVFPNSKMADEVREMIDVLRDRCGTQETARA